VKHGRIRLERTVLDLGDLAKDALETVRAEAERKGLALKYAPPQSMYVEADPGRLAQILDNLLRNAVTYTETGSVTLLLESEPRFARLTVHDTGMGIDPEEVELFSSPTKDEPSINAAADWALGLRWSRRWWRDMGHRVLQKRWAWERERLLHHYSARASTSCASLARRRCRPARATARPRRR